jgi:hypothetical protein
MTIDDVWRSPGNTLSPLACEAALRQARAHLRRIQRRRLAFVGGTALALLSVSGVIVQVWMSHGGAVSGAVPALLLLLAQWAVFGLFVRDLLAGARPMHVDGSIRESLERLRVEIEISRRRQNTVLTLYALAVPLVSAAILQLRSAGKMAESEALSAAAAFAVVIVVGTAAILAHRHWKLLPRQRRISALLEQYGSE